MPSSLAAFLLLVLGLLATRAMAVPVFRGAEPQPLQHSISRPGRHGPAISLAPNSDKVGVRFRVLSELGKAGQSTTFEVFLQPGEKTRVAKHASLPARPESFEIISIPSSGVRLRRECIVHPSFDDVAAAHMLDSGARAPMVVISDEDGEVPLYKHSEGLMAEEQEVVAYSCF